MSDLEDLKQQVYAKIQASQKPEQAPSDLDLLKASQSPAYQAHQRLRNQTQQWMKSPQGAIPAPANPLHEVEESLKSALSWLENAYALMNSNGLDKTHRELYVSICDAMTAAQEGCDRMDDAPDEICDVALNYQPPIKGKAQSPESAF